MEKIKPRKGIPGVLLFVIVCTAFVSTAAWWPPRFIKKLTTRPLEAGVAAPQFQLTAITGEIVSIGDFKGTPVLLKFWSTG